MIQQLKKSKFYEKKIPKIQFLFNIKNFDTKMFVKALATNKKFSNIFEGG